MSRPVFAAGTCACRWAVKERRGLLRLEVQIDTRGRLAAIAGQKLLVVFHFFRLAAQFGYVPRPWSLGIHGFEFHIINPCLTRSGESNPESDAHSGG